MTFRKSISCPDFIHLNEISNILNNNNFPPKTNTFSKFTYTNYDLRLKSYGNYVSKKQKTSRNERRNAIKRFYKFMSKL